MFQGVCTRVEISALVLVIAGCGGSSRPEVVPVSGTVVYNGAPVEGARVAFRTEGSPRAATGITDSDGAYTLTTFDSNDGAIPGEHTVTIAKFEQESSTEIPSANFDPANPGEAYAKAMEAAAKGQDKPDSKLPGKFADPATTPLTRTVVSGEDNVFNFDLNE